VKHLHVPPFFVGCGEGVKVARHVTANQMQDSCASVFVFKDLADNKEGFRIALEPALHGGLLREIQRVNANETLLLPVFFAQCEQPVIPECGYEMLALVRDETAVLFG